MGRDDWKSYGEAAEKGPMSGFWKILGLAIVVIVVLGFVGFVLGWFGEGAKVAQEEFGPRALLDKYTHFKDMSASLDGKRNDILVYQDILTNMKKDYGNKSIDEWPRDDRQQYRQKQSEVAGIIASYNDLAAEYNADMAKFHYRFTNVGDLPKGETKVLPREYRRYIKSPAEVLGYMEDESTYT